MITTSVLVNTYNHSHYIRACIDSLLTQTVRPNEIIVYDDGSSDGNVDILREYAAAGKITLIEGQRQKRPSYLAQANAVQTAFAACTGTLVFLLDGDDCFKREKVGRYIEVFAAHPDAALIQAPMEKISEDGRAMGFNTESRKHITDHMKEIYRQHDVDFYYPTSALAFSRSYLEQVLPLDFSDGLPLWIDTRLSIVAPFFGRVITLPDAFTDWRRHMRSDSIQVRSRRLQIRQTFMRLRVFNRFCKRRGFRPISPWRNRRLHLQLLRYTLPRSVFDLYFRHIRQRSLGKNHFHDANGQSFSMPGAMSWARRQFKTGVYHARRASVQVLSVPRAMPWVRRQLHLPNNIRLDPLALGEANGIRVVRLDDGESFHRPLPRLPNDPAAREFFRERVVDETSPSYVAELAGGAVWGHPSGGVFTADGSFIPAFTRDPWGAELHAVGTRLRLPRPRRLTGRVLYLATPEAATNYHHWMIDLLPRLGLARRAGYDLESFDHVVVNHANLAFQRETLARFGLTPEKIIATDPSLHLQADQLVVPSLKRSNQSLPAADVAFLRESFLARPAPSHRSRRLFLSRRDASFRRLVNEDELGPLLAAHNFEIVSLAGLDLEQQAQLFSEAEIIMGPSGAAFANLVFASPGTVVVEITPPQWLSVYHWMISARLGLKHAIVLGEGTTMQGTPEISARKRDVKVNPDSLAGILANPEASVAP